MSDPQWEDLKEVFHAALKLSPDERDSYLGNACDGNPALRSAAESLIKSHDETGNFVDAPVSMEYVTGDTLRQLLSRRKIETKRAIEIAAQIASALSVAHQRGIIQIHIFDLTTKSSRRLTNERGVVPICMENEILM